MGAPLTERCGSGSAAEAETGASGAPMTPRRRRRSERRNDPLPPSPPPAISGARARWPRTHCPNPSRRPDSSPNASSSDTSGPSMSGARTSPPGRRLPEWATNCSGAYWWASSSGVGASSAAAAVLRVRGSSDFPRDLAGESPRTTSPLSAEKNPCLLSFSIAPGSRKKWRLVSSEGRFASRERSCSARGLGRRS
jgi:hypothetical protein